MAGRRLGCRVRPFFPFYGSAWEKCRRGFYPEPPSDRVVVECFAGAAGFSTYYEHPRVELCDVDDNVVMTWQYLLRVTESEIRSLPDIAPGQPVDTLGVCEEAQILIGWWLGRGRPRPSKVGGDWFRRYPGQGRFWSEGVRARIARQLSRIRRWRVSHCDYRDAPAPRGCLTFVDAPYFGRPGRGYRHGSRILDYRQLGRWCRERRGTVVVCEQRGADWLPFVGAGSIRSTRGVSREVLCVLRNGRVLPQQMELMT